MSQFPLDEILLKYPECLQNNLKELVLNGIGLTNMLINIKLPPHKLSDNNDVKYDNSIILDIPYVDKFLSIEIIFNDEDFTFSPDFDILNDSFLDDPDVDLIEKCLPSLSTWSLKNPKSLLNFVVELRDLYRKHQVEKFLQEPKHSFQPEEYNLLKKEFKLNDDDMELFVGNNNQHIFIPLKLDFSFLPKSINELYFKDILENPSANQAILKINFGHRINVSLQLSPEIEQFIYEFSSLELPKYKESKTLSDYCKLISTTLIDKINDIQNQFKKKEMFISLLLSMLGYNNIIEYDSTSFMEATFFMGDESFACLVKFSLSDKFPNTKPLISFRSIYHQVSDMPISCSIKYYPYSPDWDLKQMVDKMVKKVQEELPKFETFCINKISS